MQALQKEELLYHPIQPLILARDSKKAIEQAMNVIANVKDVYIRETSALKRMDIDTFRAMQEEKMNAAIHYQAVVQQMVQRREELRQVAPDIRFKLEEQHAEFTVLLDKNMKAITRAKSTMGRVMERVKSAAQDAAEKDYSLSYGESGSMNKRQHQPLSTGVSETA